MKQPSTGIFYGICVSSTPYPGYTIVYDRVAPAHDWDVWGPLFFLIVLLHCFRVAWNWWRWDGERWVWKGF